MRWRVDSVEPSPSFGGCSHTAVIRVNVNDDIQHVVAPEFLVELNHIAELIVSGTGDIKTWGSGSDVQGLRMRLDEGGRAHVNSPAPNGYPIAFRQNFRHGSIEWFVQQPPA